MRCHYNAVNYIQIQHKRHSIARPLGQGILGVQSLMYILSQSPHRCVQYHVILDRVITALDCHWMGFYNNRRHRPLSHLANKGLSHPIQHPTAGTSTHTTPVGLVMAGCCQINYILTNIGRRNAIRILNQHPLFWYILIWTQFICFINLFAF